MCLFFTLGLVLNCDWSKVSHVIRILASDWLIPDVDRDPYHEATTDIYLNKKKLRIMVSDCHYRVQYFI